MLPTRACAAKPAPTVFREPRAKGLRLGAGARANLIRQEPVSDAQTAARSSGDARNAGHLSAAAHALVLREDRRRAEREEGGPGGGSPHLTQSPQRPFPGAAQTQRHDDLRSLPCQGCGEQSHLGGSFEMQVLLSRQVSLQPAVRSARGTVPRAPTRASSLSSSSSEAHTWRNADAAEQEVRPGDLRAKDGFSSAHRFALASGGCHVAGNVTAFRNVPSR